MNDGIPLELNSPRIFTIPPGLDIRSLYGYRHEERPQQPHDHVCEYCRTISAAERCPSCGAPRVAKRSTHRDCWPMELLETR